MTPPPRPASLPTAVWWSTKSLMWVLGETDADGELHGEVRHYRADGSLCSVTTFVHGKYHGPFRRVHETGELAQVGTYRDGKLDGLRAFMAATGPSTEPMYTGGLSREVVRIEYDYHQGRMLAARHTNAAGERVNIDGSLAPARPDHVPEGAIYGPGTQTWMAGQWDAEGRRDGEMRVFDKQGVFLATETYAADVAEGLATTFHPDGTRWTTTTYAGGRVCGAVEQFHANGQRARRSRVRGDTYTADLEDWDAAGHPLGSASWRAPPERAPVRLPDDEIDTAEALHAFIEGDHPSRLLVLIALGWGGTADRNRQIARQARRYVRSLPVVAGALASVGLDTAPRLHTARRARRLVEAMAAVPGVQPDMLAQVLAREGGAARSLGVQRADGWGLRAVRKAVVNQRFAQARQGLDRWPPTLACLPMLHEIDLSQNRLTALPDSVNAQLMLRTLRLADNRLTALPDALGRLRCLTRLTLARNRLTDVQAVTQLSALRSLNLGHNRLTFVPEAIGALTWLRQLWLNDNPLTTLPRSMATLTNLRFLHLANADWATPPAAIFELPQLETLWLHSRQLQELPEDIGNLEGLKTLVIWYSQLRAVPRALYGMTGLKELRIRHNPLPEATIKELEEALPDCRIH